MKIDKLLRNTAAFAVSGAAFVVNVSAAVPAATPVYAAYEPAAVTYADIAEAAGNDAIKEYGTAVEEGTEIPQVNNESVPETSGTTYYVDAQNGDDSNSGTSENEAWRSVEKVNSVTYQPGDRILFKAGCTWEAPAAPKEADTLDSEADTDNDGRPEEFLAPKGSGMEDEPIVLGAYGEGDLPKLVGNANVNSVVTLKDQEYWDISNLDVSNQAPDFEPNTGKDSENAKLMGNLRAIQIYGQSHSDDGITPGGTLNGFDLHDLYIHDVSGHVYWGGSPLDRGYPGVFGNMGNDASKRTGGIVFEVWEPTTESDMTEEDKAANTNDRPITFDDINISNNIICNTSFGGITIKQWSGQGHDEVNLNGFHSDAVEATNELWHRRFDTATAENGYTNEGFHPHTNVYVTNNYVSNSKTEYGCNTIRLQSVEGGLVEHNVCAGAGTCAIELDYLDDVVVQYNEVYDTRKKMGGADNNAIDTDSETTNCLIQYNYVHDNGDGFLLCGITFSTAVYRYNIIENSGAGDHYIGLYGDSGYNYVHNNLLYSSNNAGSFIGTPGGKNVDKANNPIYFENNIFFNASSGSSSPALYQGNYSYYSNNSYYGSGVNPPSSDAAAVTIDPGFSGEFENDLAAFEITEYSPLIDSGKKVEYPEGFGGEYVDRYLYGLDFYGNAADVSGKPDIGVSEYVFSDGMGIVNGYVKDSYGNPAEDAEVVLAGIDRTVSTDENGYFSFGEIAAGEYSVSVAKEQYDDSVPVQLTVTAGEAASRDLMLGESLSDTGMISGTVMSGGVPVEGVNVSVTSGGSAIAETLTDKDGKYTLEVPAGTGYTLIVAKDGYKYRSVSGIEIQKGNMSTEDIVLQSNDYSDTQYFINDGFNEYNAGMFESNDVWTVYGISEDSKTVTIEEEGDNKYLRLSKNTTASGDVGIYNTEKAGLGGNLTIEARIMRTTDGSGSYNQVGMYTFNENDWQGSGSSKNPIATFFMSNGKISAHYKNETGGNSVYDLCEYEFGRWYTVRCTVNLDTKTYDLYVDDMSTPVLSNYPLRNASKDIIDRFLIYSNALNTGDICIDYFRVCTGTPYDYNDAALGSVTVNGTAAEKVSDTEYSFTVLSDTDTAAVEVSSQSPFASVEIDGNAVGSAETTLVPGENRIVIAITAEDGTRKEYTLNIYRATEEDERDAELASVKVNGITAENAGGGEYRVEVPSDTDTLKVEPEAFDSFYAVVAVNGAAVENGSAELAMDSDTVEVDITVISKIGITKEYTLIISRAEEPVETDDYVMDVSDRDISDGTAAVTVRNNTGSAKSACAVIAVYSGGRLAYTDVKTIELSAEADTAVEFDGITADGNVKFMLWQSANDMIPFCDAVE